MRNCLSGQSPYQESYAAGSKSQSELRGGHKRKEAPAKTFHHSVYVILLDLAVLQHRSILRLNPNRDPAKPSVYVGMTGLAVQDRFQNHKKRSKVGLDRKKVRSPLDARAVRIFKSDAFRGSGSDGKGFGGRSASGGLHCRWWHLGLANILGSDAARVLNAAFHPTGGHRLAADRHTGLHKLLSVRGSSTL